MLTKDDWLLENLRCPTCLAPHLDRDSTGWRCNACGVFYPMAGRCANFITDNMVSDFSIIDNSKPSDHPYNPTALEIIDKVSSIDGMILDCGAGHRDFTSKNVLQVEIMPYPNIDVMAVNQILPFNDNSFDAIFSFDVLEHVNDPFSSAAELARVLKPGGFLYIDLPFLQLEHGYPHHYFNATRRGLQRLFEGLLKVQGHVVPQSGHPAHLIWTALNNYRNGLPKEGRAALESMTIGDLLQKSWKELRDSEVGAIHDDVKWKMASATQAIFSKNSTGDRNSRLELDVMALPNFRGRSNYIE